MSDRYSVNRKCLLIGVDRAWIGLNDMRAEGQWVWDSGEPVTYVNWAAGEPNDVRGNEDCVEVLATHRRGWNDNQCDQRFPGVCKRPKGADYFLSYEHLKRCNHVPGRVHITCYYSRH